MTDLPPINEEKEVWLVVTNSDLTEGRGQPVRLAFCEEYATGLRIAKGKGVQGTNAEVARTKVFSIEGRAGWYGIVSIEKPTTQDLADQSVIDVREAALSKARELGLTDDEIRHIQRAT